MLNQFSRTELILGKESIQKLHKSKVAIFGIGGVGSFVVEGLTRAGIENFVFIDNDTISLSNLNRQIHATHKTIGKYKVDVMEERCLEINPNVKIEKYKLFYLPETSENIIDNSFDYVIDCIDTVKSKIDIVLKCQNLKIPIISCMGTGNKIDPTKLEVSDIYKTEVCPLAKIIRKELRNRGVKKLKVVYSKELPIKPKYLEDTEEKNIPGSVSFVPSVAGMIIAGEVVKDIISENN